ncbi:MAG: MBOAT family protein, partial [Clostridia bacterium]|nr:MBOAT family protein [Clostridia bacterium]
TVCLGVNRVYNNLESFQGFALIFATVLFTVQIFCDFSGYSDIARGCARIMGFRLMRNFDHPYFSSSVKEFWRRWHISLSTWFKDYVYIPLGGNRKGKGRTNLNLLITFLVSGLWHGANWTFLLWGVFHAVLQILERYTKNFFEKLAHLTRLEKLPTCRRVFKICFTFCLICFGWIFFRANTIGDAGYVISHLFRFKSISFGALYTTLKLMFETRAEVYRLFLTFPVFVIASFIDRKWSLNKLITKQNSVIRFVIYVAIVVYILLAARADIQDFIYFQF